MKYRNVQLVWERRAGLRYNYAFPILSNNLGSPLDSTEDFQGLLASRDASLQR